MSGSLSVRCALRALAEPAAGQDSNGMHCRHLALLGSRTGEARASVGTAPSNRHIRGMTWRRSLCGSGCAGRPSIGVRVRCCDAVPTAGYGSVPVAAKPAGNILTVRMQQRGVFAIEPAPRGPPASRGPSSCSGTWISSRRRLRRCRGRPRAKGRASCRPP